MNKKISITFIFLAFLFQSLAFGRSVQKMPIELHNLIIESINDVFNEDFKKALLVAKQIIKLRPDHPAGYFFYAGVLDAEMEFTNSSVHEVEFYKYCDLAVEKGEKLLEKNPDDMWVKFFVAGSYGAKGTYESRYERWITAFRYGWQGVSIFKELVKEYPDLIDAEFGISTYDYWRSAMINTMWWMPKVSDKRAEAITNLKKISKKSIYVKEASSKHLVSILNNEKRYKETIVIADNMLAKYPNNLIFMWAKAEANFGLKNFNIAEREYKHILEIVSGGNGYSEALCHYFLAKIYFGQKRYSLCEYECNKTASIHLEKSLEKRFEKKMDEIYALKKRSKSASKKNIKDLIK